ncbi:MmpS family protein [Mycobacterium paraterrae]|uniref:MmpS family protein n=2 Tax=Mycobacterium paraterrae TaxID=577492 RepID=A0ABY3W010_9MYCO|nr:MmpS family transport accessory protein [Mycobacterium paraterrae]UMB72443.1 MmpS family protein [Mycobacterium paraterrae]
MLQRVSRMWVAVAVATVVALGAIAVQHLRGVFGSDAIFTETAPQARPLPQTTVKTVTYEVLGEGAASGRLSYLDANSRSHDLQFDSLPWSRTITTTLPSVLASLVAQGDESALRCRITVNGQVKDEHVAATAGTQTFCLVKAA